jgi:hypothetical protein
MDKISKRRHKRDCYMSQMGPASKVAEALTTAQHEGRDTFDDPCLLLVCYAAQRERITKEGRKRWTGFIKPTLEKKEEIKTDKQMRVHHATSQ